jgi:hypothetical protein
MAMDMKINTRHMKKKELIHAIQHAEKNIECFGTPRVDFCEESSCLWRTDCISLNHTHPSKA